MGFLGALLSFVIQLLGPSVILVYPLCASIKAIETSSEREMVQWLSYWIIYSFIALFELSFWDILVWFPLWALIKLAICFWLVLPGFHGATYVYHQFVAKLVKEKLSGLFN